MNILASTFILSLASLEFFGLGNAKSATDSHIISNILMQNRYADIQQNILANRIIESLDQGLSGEEICS